MKNIFEGLPAVTYGTQYEPDMAYEYGEAGLSGKAQKQIAQERQLINELETEVEEHPFEDTSEAEKPERKSSNGNCRQKPLHGWRTLAERSVILKISLRGGISWM